MKKITLTALVLSLVLSLSACSESADSSSTASKADAASKTSESVAEETNEGTSAGTPEDSPYTIEADFSKGPSPEWYASSGWSNGSPFDCMWSENNVKFEDGVMKLVIDELVEGAYNAGEYRTNEVYGYGLYEVSLKAIKNNGVVSSYFTYTGPSDDNPWDEIDIEVLGKDTTKVQFNYYTNGVGGHEYMYDLGFDASEDFHTYAFKWEEGKITWYVDGVEAYSADKDIPVTPGRIMMNAWNGIGVDSWLKKFDGTVPLTAEYQWARFTAE